MLKFCLVYKYVRYNSNLIRLRGSVVVHPTGNQGDQPGHVLCRRRFNVIHIVRYLQRTGYGPKGKLQGDLTVVILLQ